MAKTFVGTWETNWVSPDTGQREGLILTVTESSATVLYGMYEIVNGHPGTMYGNLSRNTWKGTWMNSPTEKGTFSFTLGGEPGDSFKGTYTVDGRSGEWAWNSTKLKLRHTAPSQ